MKAYKNAYVSTEFLFYVLFALYPNVGFCWRDSYDFSTVILHWILEKKEKRTIENTACIYFFISRLIVRMESWRGRYRATRHTEDATAEFLGVCVVILRS